MATADSRLPSLDGLRAIAVGAVLLYHAGFGWFGGGYIGVDVFFVLSGFLITRLIVRDLGAGRFSLRSFYARRIARLFPALFVMLAATLVAGVIILSPDELMRLGRSAIAAAFSGSNILFFFEAGYFEPLAAGKPLLHTWSLGVEEQFYLVWPFLLIGLFALRRPRLLLAGLALVAIVSLVASAVLVGAHPEAVFFLTPFRAFEFAAGGLVALGTTVRPGTGRDAAAFAGVGLVILLGVLLGYADVTGTGRFALDAVLPTLATVAFLWGAEGTVARRTFSLAPLVWIGRRSYSIYLAHWPLAVFWRLAGDTSAAWWPYAQIAASILLGTVLYELVERRFRVTGPSPQPRRLRWALGVTVALVFIVTEAGTVMWATKGLPGRVEATMFATAADNQRAYDARMSAVHDRICTLPPDDATIADYDPEICANPPAGRRAYLVIGDSWAGDTYLVLKRAFPDIYFGLLSVPGCRLRLPAAFEPGVGERCREDYAYAFDNLVRADLFEGVVMSAAWDPPYSQVQDMIDLVENRGMRAIVMSQHLSFERRVPDIVTTSRSFAEAEALAQSLVQRFRRTQDAELLRFLPDPSVYVDFATLQCREICDIVDRDGRLLFMDHIHLTLPGVDLVARRFLETYPDLFERTPAAG